MAARTWLGRDAFAVGAPKALRDAVAAADAVRGALTKEPRRYCFHATLKAPFRLKEGTSVEELERALRRFVAVWPPCPIGPLKIDLLGGFFALVPVSPVVALRGFASHIVGEFDRFRAPMNQAELQRRSQSPLDELETTNLVRWGYPYVFDRFRFHMTLTNRVPVESRPAVRKQLDETFAPAAMSASRGTCRSAL